MLREQLQKLQSEYDTQKMAREDLETQLDHDLRNIEQVQAQDINALSGGRQDTHSFV